MHTLYCNGLSQGKPDVFFDRKNILNSPASTIRIYNFTNGLLNVSVNNIQLTNFIEAKDVRAAPSTGTEMGLAFFPKGVWPSGKNGSPLTLPATLLDKYSRARIYIVPGYDKDNTSPIIPGLAVDTVLQDDPLHPVDYFLLSDGHFRAIPRSVAVPVAPDHFKIRILNLGAANDPLRLSGPVTMTYADGAPVHDVLNGVGIGMVSEYIEVPYGSYQFKLFVDNNHQKQLCELPVSPYIDVCTQKILPQTKIFPFVRTFKPGGTYSVIVTQNTFIYDGCGPEDIVYESINSYRIVEENNPPLNTSYARVMGANALADQSILFKLDGKEMGIFRETGKATDPQIVITGKHTLAAFDNSGNLLAEKSCNFSAADFYTAWVYDKGGKPDLIFTSNNMAISHYVKDPPGDDGTDGDKNITKYDYAWQSRFLNLSEDIPYATFTNQDGENFEFTRGGGGIYQDVVNPRTSYQNMEPGQIVMHEPSVIAPYTNNNRTTNKTGSVGFSYMPSLIRVFQSTPGPLGQTPGNWLSAIAPLRSQDFIANPGLYETGLPAAESGAYSIALIGRLKGGSGKQKARLIFVKHNK